MTSVRALALILIASLAVACKAHEAPPAAPAHPEGEAWLTAAQLESGQIELTQAKVVDLPTEITTSGRITFDDLRVAHVFSPVTGRVAGILAQPGQHVSAGQALAVIDSPDVGAALADLQKAKADSTAAAHELQRQHELADAGAGTPRDLEQAEDNAAKAKAEEARAQARMKLLRGAGEGGSERFTLRSPIAGEVIARAVNPGVEVQGQYGGGQAVELFTVGSSDLVWVVADVYEMDLPRVSERAPVRVTVPSFPHDHWDGHIEQVAGALDPATRTARVRATLKNPRHELRPEM
ncbi:MAG: efflux RND transporter periplasmic adaptor subunit, partial [Deltaproteobacteria bacterium]|nr:efflux RND transporter periplasmic adaptor subunit [Deltaproteobacteria bacterium]